MKFGGTSKFGAAVFGGEPYAVQPGYYVDRILQSLSRFQRISTGGVITGFVNTLARFTGSIRDRATARKVIDLATHAQTPAFLVGFGGGEFTPWQLGGASWMETLDLSVICITSHFDSRLRRLEGRNPITDPGLDAMCGMAITFGMRELLLGEELHNPRPTSRRYFEFSPTRFVAFLEFKAEIYHEAFDDAHDPALGVLTKLGIVHSPLNLNQLFLPDNVTPNVGAFDPIDEDPTGPPDPTSPATGVADL